MKTKQFKVGDVVNVAYGNFGKAEIISKGRANTFNHLEDLYKVRSIATGQEVIFNELHFSENKKIKTNH